MPWTIVSQVPHCTQYFLPSSLDVSFLRLLMFGVACSIVGGLGGSMFSGGWAVTGFDGVT